MSVRRLACVAVALLALCAMSVGSIATAAPGSTVAPDASAAKKKKKCKKGKKKGAKKGTAAKKKKCGKKKKGKGKGKTPAPPKASGPEIPVGTYPCSSTTLGYAGTVHILSGNRYMVNEGPAVGSYVYYPDTGVMQFPSGDYDSFYGVYVPDSKGFDVHYAKTDEYGDAGDYGWTCYLDQ